MNIQNSNFHIQGSNLF